MNAKLETLKSLYNAQNAGEAINWMELDYSTSNWYSMKELAHIYSLECPNIKHVKVMGYRLTVYQVVAGDIVNHLIGDIKQAVKMERYPHLYCSKCGEYIGNNEDDMVEHFGECH